MLTAKEKQLLAALEPRAAAEGVEIVTIEIVGAKRAPSIRIYVDTLDESPVSFDVLSASQSWIGDIMDEIDPFPGAYTMEVSSPGIDRPLRTPEHFRRFSGEEVAIRTVEPLEGRSNFTGELLSMDGDDVLMAVDGEEVRIPYDNVKKAHVQGTFDFKSINECE